MFLEQMHTLVFTPHWQVSKYWPGLKEMHEAAPWREHYATWLSPGLDVSQDQPWTTTSGQWRSPSYRYSNSFVGDPWVWSESWSNAEQAARPTRIQDVRYPFGKVIMYDLDRAYLTKSVTENDPRPLLFVDSSASLRRDTEATEPVQNQDWSAPPRPYHDTPKGVLGRDF